MAVKKHELMAASRSQLDLGSLAEYIQMMNEQPSYLPPRNELVKRCEDIVKCLARTPVTKGDVQQWHQLQSIEVFLLRLVNTYNSNLRQEIISAVLDTFYSIICDPQSDACPATSIALIIFDGAEPEAMLSAARWLIQKEDNGPAGTGLRASLACLYKWTSQWHSTNALGSWTLTFIKALEEKEYYNLLIEVSLANIEQLFISLDASVSFQQSIADVIFHVLASLRESIEALERISCHVGRVLVNLAADSGQWSRQLLQNVVDIVTAMVEGHLQNDSAADVESFKEKYTNVINCLERHMASKGSRFLLQSGWCTRVNGDEISSKPTVPLTGLLNLGNTCYVNSILQALYVTRQFSTHVMLRMTAVPYWAKMSSLFAKMMYSYSNKLNPTDLFTVVKPPFFTMNHQHDSSEFLGYLFELLQTYEHYSDINFDYTRPPLGFSRMRTIAMPPSFENDSGNESGGSNRRSMSPRPGGSGLTSNAKRTAEEDKKMPPKKRMRYAEPTVLRNYSIIDYLFGGLLLTRTECSECNFSSVSRDVFKDLQLSFPEKPEPGRQHSVQSLLEFYCSKERLSGENRYECPDCRGLKDAERSVIIESAPKYLILVLKNFRFEPKLQVQTKLMHSMHYNHMITLPTYRSQTQNVYQLYAAVIHSGTTLDSGHYYTLAKDSEQWNIYNDELVMPSHEAELHSLTNCCTPYILFYRRTDIEEGVAPAMEDLPPRLQEQVMSHNKQYFEDSCKARMTRP